jgi:hypothetical protein
MAVPIVSVKAGLPVGQGRIRLIPASDYEDIGRIGLALVALSG